MEVRPVLLSGGGTHRPRESVYWDLVFMAGARERPEARPIEVQRAIQQTAGVLRCPVA